MDQIKACQRISSVFDMSSGILCSEFKAPRYSAYHKTKKSHWDAKNGDHTEN